MARISSVTTPQPKPVAPLTVGRVVPAAGLPPVKSALFDCHAGDRHLDVDFGVRVPLPTPTTAMDTLPPKTNRTWRLSIDSVPVAPPSGSRVGRILKVYIELKATPSEAMAIQVTGAKQLNSFKKDLRKYAEKDGYYAKCAGNAESTILYCWLVKQEK